ncbi:hypothetical protein O59_002542 [Cellvibrio sp. BR]|nr:hypothetical protein O59_002542 [Cellvibrio sp. BR]
MAQAPKPMNFFPPLHSYPTFVQAQFCTLSLAQNGAVALSSKTTFLFFDPAQAKPMCWSIALSQGRDSTALSKIRKQN